MSELESKLDYISDPNEFEKFEYLLEVAIKIAEHIKTMKYHDKNDDLSGIFAKLFDSLKELKNKSQNIDDLQSMMIRGLGGSRQREKIDAYRKQQKDNPGIFGVKTKSSIKDESSRFHPQ